MENLININKKAINHSILSLKSKVFERYELKHLDLKYRRLGKDHHYANFAINNDFATWIEYWESCKNEAIEIFGLISDLCNPFSSGYDIQIQSKKHRLQNELFEIVKRIDQEISDLKNGTEFRPVINIPVKIEEELIDNLPIGIMSRSLYKEALRLMNTSEIKNKPKRTAQVEKITPYADLFGDKRGGPQLKSILTAKGYLNDQGIWVGLTKERAEFLVLVKLLTDENILKIPKIASNLRSFAKEFGFQVSQSDKNFIYQPNCGKKSSPDIESIFNQLNDRLQKSNFNNRI